ncbi:unnamed protein product [Urochloa humidicola]
MATQGPDIRGGDGDITGGGGVLLQQDVLYEILLRVPVRPLCRFRSVCQSWRSLLSDPPFAAAHAARHRGDPPLFAVCVAGGSHGEVAEIKIVDTSGHALKRVNAGPSLPLDRMLPHHDLVLTIGVERHPLRVLDPATSAVSILMPDDDVSHHSYSFVFGRAAADSTGGDGEYKVLGLSGESCKVLTINDSGNGRWRAAPGPPVSNIIEKFHSGTVVVKGVVYHPVYHGDCWKIAGFDLYAEQWQPSLLQGPPTELVNCGGWFGFLAAVNGHLAAVSYYTDSTIEIWMIMDSVELAIWCKQCRVGLSSIERFHGAYPKVRPLSVLDDGRVALWVCFLFNRTGALWIYDPRTETCIHVVTIENCLEVGVGMYTGNLLRHSRSCSTFFS